jgi:hypothetical protein
MADYKVDTINKIRHIEIYFKLKNLSITKTLKQNL